MDMQQLANLSQLLRKHSTEQIEFGLNLMLCFSIVAQNPGIRQKEVVKMTGLTYPTVHNCFNNLSHGRPSKSKVNGEGTGKPVMIPGLGVIRPDINIYDKRGAVYTLTEKGEQLAKEIGLI